MKTFKKTALAAILLLAAALCFVLAACGSYSLDVGTYTGTYKCHYSTSISIAGTGPSAGQITVYESDHWGAVVTFDVDQHSEIWNLVVAAPEPDADSNNEEYLTYVSAGMSNTFISQFGGWTLNEIMAIDVTTNDAGFPTEIDGGGKNITIPSGQTGTCGLVILAMQNAIETGTPASSAS